MSQASWCTSPMIIILGHVRRSYRHFKHIDEYSLFHIGSRLDARETLDFNLDS